MPKLSPLWLQCSCGLMILSDEKVIAPRPHPTFNAKQTCPGTDFRIESDPSAETIRRARAELERRIKKQSLTKPPTKRAYKQGSGTSRWEGVRSTTARPSKGSAGAPTLGKR
jgi:hypothetical protein